MPLCEHAGARYSRSTTGCRCTAKPLSTASYVLEVGRNSYSETVQEGLLEQDIWATAPKGGCALEPKPGEANGVVE